VAILVCRLVSPETFPTTHPPWSPGGPGGQAALDAAIVITTPQQLSLVDVEKGIRSLARCDSAPGNGEYDHRMDISQVIINIY